MMIKRLAALALAGAMVFGAALAQTNPGTSPLSVTKGGTGNATYTANCILYGNVVSPILCATKVNNGVLTFNGSGVPTASTTLPSAVQDNITRAGTIVSGVWNATPLVTAYIGDNQVTDGKLRQSGALALIGRSANSTGNVADIQATAASGCAFREASNVIGCGTLATAALGANIVTDAKIRQGSARTVIGRASGTTGDVADIAATSSSDAVLRESGGSIGFGTIATAGIANNAVTDAKLRQGSALSVIGRSANSSGNVADIAAANDNEVLRRSGTSIGFGTIATGGIAANAVTNSKLAAVSGNTLKGNPTGSSADPSDISMPSCSTSSSALTWTTDTGFGCNTISGGGGASTVQKGYIYGLTLSTAGSSSTFSVAPGEATDSSGADVMALGSAYSKTTSSWAVGSGNGALDTGTIANNTWYHVYEIKRADTGVVDVLISLSATSPTLPTDYTLFRRIGSVRTDSSSQWVQFSQDGDEFLWSTSVRDVNGGSQGNTASLYTLTVPPDIKIKARFRASANQAATWAILFSSPDESDQAVATTGPANLGGSAGIRAVGEFSIRTNSSAQVRARSSVASTSLDIWTYGWVDRRGK